MKAEVLQLTYCFRNCPMVLDDPIDSHHASGPICALFAVDKDRAIDRILDYFQEFAYIFVFRMPCFAVKVFVLKIRPFEQVPVAMKCP